VLYRDPILGSHKGISYRGAIRDAIQGLIQGCHTGVPYTGVAYTGAFYRGVIQRCHTEVPYRVLIQGCHAGVPYRSAIQERNTGYRGPLRAWQTLFLEELDVPHVSFMETWVRYSTYTQINR
jgi:hypothetical protein